MTGALARIDSHVGNAIESMTCRHHRRRLELAGWSRAFDATSGPWASGSFPTREGNALQVFIDGADALPAIAAAVRSARSHVHIAGWAISAGFAMERDERTVTLRALLAEAAERVEVRVLVWAGAPLHLFHPTRAETRAAMAELTRGTRIRAARDPRNRPMHCHHEKLVVIDDEHAFVGGIDLTHVGGDRFDGAPHERRTRLGWHDAAALVRGPAAADVAAHFAMRWAATTGEHLSTPSPAPHHGGSRVQVVRTVPEGNYEALRDGEFSILEAYTGALRSAQRLIYLENQFLWSPEIVAILRDRLLDPPNEEFRVVIVLPSKANNGSDDTLGQLAVLLDADRHGRLLAGTIGPPGRDRPRVYVHAKIAVVDDAWLTIGSANLNEHSLFNDTEMNVVTDDAGLARWVRETLWTEHLGADCTAVDPVSVLEEQWRPALRPGNVATPLRALPLASRRASRLLGPLNGLVVDG